MTAGEIQLTTAKTKQTMNSIKKPQMKKIT